LNGDFDLLTVGPTLGWQQGASSVTLGEADAIEMDGHGIDLSLLTTVVPFFGSSNVTKELWTSCGC
jgi:hypothetical protein